MDRHATHSGSEPQSPFLGGGTAEWRAAVILIGLLVTILVSSAYSQALFGVGLLAAPLVAGVFVLGVAFGLAIRAILAAHVAFGIFLTIAAVVVIDTVMNGDSRILFWFVLMPSIGAMVTTVPLGHGDSLPAARPSLATRDNRATSIRRVRTIAFGFLVVVAGGLPFLLYYVIFALPLIVPGFGLGIGCGVAVRAVTSAGIAFSTSLICLAIALGGIAIGANGGVMYLILLVPIGGAMATTVPIERGRNQSHD